MRRKGRLLSVPIQAGQLLRRHRLAMLLALLLLLQHPILTKLETRRGDLTEKEAPRVLLAISETRLRVRTTGASATAALRPLRSKPLVLPLLSTHIPMQ